MDIKPGTSAIAKIIINLLITFTFTFIGFLLLPSLLWSRPNTNISFHALLGLLAFMTGAMAILRARNDLRISNVLLYSSFMILGLLHLVGAFLYFIGLAAPGSNQQPYRLVATLFEITLFLALLSAALILETNTDITITQKFSRKYGILIPFVALISFGIAYALILPILPPLVLNLIAFFLVGLTIGIIIFTIRSIARYIQTKKHYDKFWLVNGLVLYAFAAPIILVSLITMNQMWILSTIFISFALISFNLAVSIPQMSSTGMGEKNAFLYSFVWNLFILLPFIAAFLLEFLTSMPLTSYELYAAIRLGAAIISIGIAVLLFLYSQQKFTRSFIPLMLAFVTWALVDVVLLLQGPLVLTYSESLVPYIIGYITVFLLLITAVYWKQHPPLTEGNRLPILGILFSIAGIMLMLGVSMALESWLVTTNPGMFYSPLDRIILLSLNFVNVFWFAVLGYFYLQESKGKMTVELLGLSFLMLWIIPGILKGIFGMWEFGWWAGEYLLLGGLMVGPIIFGIAYLRAMKTAEEVEKRATLYADILAHDISNYHQAILTSLEIIEMEDVPKEIEAQAMDQIHQSLSRADHLIKNVRRLGKVEHIPQATFQPLDLVMYINLAFNQVRRALGDSEFTLKCNRKEGRCFVNANILLIDLFQNLIRNAMEYSNSKKRIEIKIKRLNNRDQPWWEVQIIDFGRGISPERKAQLFNRYMDGAHGSGLGLSVVRALSEAFGGWVTVQDRVPGDYQKGTVFLVYLPAIATKKS